MNKTTRPIPSLSGWPRLVVIVLLALCAFALSACQTATALGDIAKVETTNADASTGEQTQTQPPETEPPEQPPKRSDPLGVKLLGAIAETISGIDALSAAVIKRANYSIERVGNTLLVTPDPTPLKLPAPESE